MTTFTGAEARRAARNASAIAIASVLSKGALFGWQLILAPWLGAAAYGIYGTVGALIAVAAVVPQFGMGQIVIRDVARQPDDAGSYFSATLVIRTLLALLAYVLMVGGAWIAPGYSDVILAFAAIAGISLIVDTFGNLCFDLLLAQERMVVASAVDVAHIALRVGLAGAALLAGYGLFGVYVATIISGVVRSLALTGALIRAGVRPSFPVNWRGVAIPLLVNSAPLALASFLSLAYQHADKLMTTSILDETQTAYLTAAFVVIFGVVELLSTTVLMATYPMMSRSGEGSVFGFMVDKLAYFTLLVSLPLALTLGVFATEFVVIFGADFRPTAEVLRILIWYALVTMVVNVFAQALLVQNKQRRLLVIRGSGLLLNLCLNAVLLTRLGVQGAAVATVASECAVLVLMLVDFHAEGYSRSAAVRRLLRAAFAGAVVAAVMLALRAVHPLAGLAGGAMVYLLAVFVGGLLSHEDWDLLYRLLAAMPGGGVVRRVWQREVAVSWDGE